MGVRPRILVLFALVAAGGLAALAAGLWLGYRRLGLPGALPDFVQAGLVAGFGFVGVVAGAWYLADGRFGRTAGRLAAALRAGAHAAGGAADPGPVAAAPDLGDLAPASAAILAELAATRSALADAVARETERLAGEKARLEALLSDVPSGVLLCSGAHQLAFYNGPATELLGAAGQPGLDRPVFDYLRAAPLIHAHDRLSGAADNDAVADLMVATADGSRVLSARMRLLDGAAPRGYVLTLRDVTADLAASAGRDRLLDTVFDGIRRPAANLQSVVGVIDEGGGGPALDMALRQEVANLVRCVTDLGARYDAARGGWTALPSTRAADLADGLSARLEGAGLTLEVTAADLILRCDGFEIVALLGLIARGLAAGAGPRSFTLDIAEDGAGALIRLGWQGTALPVRQLEDWLGQPVDAAAADVTGQRVLTTHATEIWPETATGGGAVLLPVREARRASGRVAPIARAVVYDFDLLFKPRAAALAEARLTDLTYVVFDTETTGLSPETGDEIVQIAGLRLVNGRRVAGEVFDMLVDPGRPIPPRATAVHGIADAMVAGAPGPVAALARFHKFAEGAVLIAHNAPFDMTFLRRREAEIGRPFDHPILDTVLLSAVVYGRTEDHSLDALVHRLGITLPEEARHTAIGDAEATAEAFLRLLPILSARGFATFGDILAEVRKHGRLLRDLNA